MHDAAVPARFRAGPTIQTMSTRRRSSAAATCLALFVATTSARAADEWTAAPAATDRALPSFALAVGATYMDYVETVPAPVKSAESGFLPDGQLAAALTLPNRLLLRATFGFAVGSLAYDGTTQTGSPLAGNHSSATLDPEIDVGYRFTRGDAVRAALYVGLGFHYWRRDLSSLPSGGYLEEYSWWQAPLGLVVDSGTAGAFTAGVDVAVVPSFGGQVAAHLSDLSPTLADLHLTVGDAFGFRAAVPLSWHLGSVRLFAAPSYRYIPLAEGPVTLLRDANGNPVTLNGQTLGAREPDSRAHLVALDLGVGF